MQFSDQQDNLTEISQSSSDLPIETAPSAHRSNVFSYIIHWIAKLFHPKRNDTQHDIEHTTQHDTNQADGSLDPGDYFSMASDLLMLFKPSILPQQSSCLKSFALKPKIDNGNLSMAISIDGFTFNVDSRFISCNNTTLCEASKEFTLFQFHNPTSALHALLFDWPADSHEPSQCTVYIYNKVSLTQTQTFLTPMTFYPETQYSFGVDIIYDGITILQIIPIDNGIQFYCLYQSDFSDLLSVLIAIRFIERSRTLIQERQQYMTTESPQLAYK